MNFWPVPLDQSDGGFKVTAYAHAALEAAGSSFRLTAEEQAELKRAAGCVPISLRAIEVTTQPNQSM